jgi:hypothetical protein
LHVHGERSSQHRCFRNIATLAGSANTANAMLIKTTKGSVELPETRSPMCAAADSTLA